MYAYDPLDLAKFATPEPVTGLQPDGVKPDFATLSSRSTWTWTGSIRSL